MTPGRPALRPTREHEHRLWRHPGIPAFCHRVVRSFRLQPPTAVPTCFWVFCVRLTGPRCRGRPLGAMRHLGFASSQQARHCGRPNRVHLRYGLIVQLRLLSTPPRGDAVTFGYGVPEHSGRDFHPADSMQLQAHWDKIPILSWLNPSKYKMTRLESCPTIGGRFASLPEPGRPEGGPNTDRGCPTGLVNVAGEVIPAGRLRSNRRA